MLDDARSLTNPCQLTHTGALRPHEAGWCCGAWNAKRSKHCGQRAGQGTDHKGVGRCKIHFGNSPNHERAAQLEIARRECDRLGIAIQVDPAQGLLDDLWEVTGNVEFYRNLVAELPTHPEPDRLETADDGDMHWRQGEIGIYGRTYHQSGVPTGEAKRHILVQMYDDERRHKLAVEVACLKANIEERRVRMIEADATKILGAQAKALVTMGLEDRAEEFRHAFVDALRAGDAIDVGQPARLGAHQAG